MAKRGAVPRSVILLVVLLVQFCPRTLQSVSAARYAPAVVSPEETGRTWGASLVPRDVGAAGSKLERRLSDDREESTRGAAHEDTGNESVHVKTNERPPSSHGHHHHPCLGDRRYGKSRYRSNADRKGGDGVGCGRGVRGRGRQGSEGGGSGSHGGDGGYGGDSEDGGDGGWTKGTYAKGLQKKIVSKGNGRNRNDNSNRLDGEFGPGVRSGPRGPGGPGDGRGPGGGRPGGGGGPGSRGGRGPNGRDRGGPNVGGGGGVGGAGGGCGGGPGDGRGPGGGRPGCRQPGGR